MLSMSQQELASVDYGAPTSIVISFPFTDARYQEIDDTLKTVSLDLTWMVQQVFYYGFYFRASFTFTDYLRQLIAEHVFAYKLNPEALREINAKQQVIIQVGEQILAECFWFIQELKRVAALISAEPRFDLPLIVSRQTLQLTFWWAHQDEYVIGT